MAMDTRIQTRKSSMFDSLLCYCIKYFLNLFSSFTCSRAHSPCIHVNFNERNMHTKTIAFLHLFNWQMQTMYFAVRKFRGNKNSYKNQIQNEIERN